MQDKELIEEFLVESAENLARLDQEIVELERQPGNKELLGSVFRTIHTIKGTCGFLGFPRLERVAHLTENLLNDVRNGARPLDGALTTVILEGVDGIRRFLSAISHEGREGSDFEGPLVERLTAASEGRSSGAATLQVPAPPAAMTNPQESEIRQARRPFTHTEVHAEAHDVAPAAGPATVADARLEQEKRETALAETTLRVDVGLVDRLMNQVGELVLTRNQVLQFNASREDTALNSVAQRLNLITAELQEGVMKMRMQPIGVVWNKMPRVVRDLAASLGKRIEVELVGSQTELDRAVIEAIKDPLTHLVRNSCDHGIEKPESRLAAGKPAAGSLKLRAFHVSGQVVIEIEDDGAGIDSLRVRAKAVERGLLTAEQAQQLSEEEALNLIFLPGFSTAREVTNVSGRGVGMDVVRTNIERINGAVELSSVAGRGTTVRVRIPLTLAIIPGLVVTADGERFVVPQLNLQELIRLEGSDLKRVERVERAFMLRHRGRLLPLAHLTEVLELVPAGRAAEPPEVMSVVVVQVEGLQFGLVVDRINDTQEIVVKPISQQIKGLHVYAGATIMGDGRVALILDVAGLGRRANVLAQASRRAAETPASEAVSGADQCRKRLLLFRAGEFSRLAITLSQVARLEKIPVSLIEQASSREVIQYRGQVLPLVRLGEALGGYASTAGDTIEVIVHGQGTRARGLVVDEIVDIVDETVRNLSAPRRCGLLGSGVVGGRMTDFLDLEAVAGSLEDAEDGTGLARLKAALEVDERTAEAGVVP